MCCSTKISESGTSNRLTLSVPVTTTDIDEFCECVNLFEMSVKISEFVKTQLAENGVNKVVFRYDIHEIIKNSFDSFISTGAIVLDSSLFFSADVKGDEENINIKFKDNGKGVDKEGEFFEIDEIKSSKIRTDFAAKPIYTYFGGNGMALSQMNEAIQRQGGSMQLKNRKVAGCTVSIRFKKD